MIYLIIILILLQVLPILFTFEVHTHPIHREYGIRLVGASKVEALVIGLGLRTIRIEGRK
jgi:hypothetical protein